MDMIAARFGPGMYRVICGNGPSARRNSTINVTPEFAENAGWAAPPVASEPVSPLQLQANQTFIRATQGGNVSPVELAAMIETAVNAAMDRTRPRGGDGLNSLMRGFELANTLQAKALEQARTMLGMSPQPEVAAAREVGWPEVALQVVPAILEGLKALAPPQPPPPPAAPQPAQVAQPQTLAHHAPPPETAPVPVQPNPLPEPPPAARPVINLMAQYAAALRAPLESTATAQELAAQLSDLVGPALDPSVMDLADYVQQHGPAVLGHVAPFFATDKAAAVVIEWANIIRSEGTGGES